MKREKRILKNRPPAGSFYISRPLIPASSNISSDLAFVNLFASQMFVFVMPSPI